MDKGNTASFSNADAAAASPLAAALFAVNHVEGVFFGQDFISVTSGNEGNWSTLKPLILTTIMEHFVSGRPLFDDAAAAAPTANSSDVSEDDDEIVVQLKELINTRVRPAVAEDGGDIVFKEFKDGIVYLELYGACSGCPSSTITLKQGIENMLKHYVPEVEAVEAVNSPAEL